MECVNVSCTVMQDHTLNLPQILNYTLLGAPALDVQAAEADSVPWICIIFVSLLYGFILISIIFLINFSF